MLVYFLANSGEDMRNIDVSLDAKFHISYDAIEKSLNIVENKNYLKGYWGTNITGLTTLVGKNGVGKSSLLNLIKDRCLFGSNHPENTILIYKKKDQYYLFYDEKIFEEKNKIKINGVNYKVKDSLLYGDHITNIKEQEIIIRIETEELKISVGQVLKKEKENQACSQGIETHTRLGKGHSLIFHTNNWSYSRRNRLINRTKGLDYFDCSIGERIDKVIQEHFEYIPPIADIADVYKIQKDDRFQVDYLFKLQEEEMQRTLTYLEDESNYNLLKQHFNIPEELYIQYDFMDSEKRSNIYTLDEAYLRFEYRKKNFKHENKIYDYLYPNGTIEIKVKEALMLSIIEKLFTDVQLMVPRKLISAANVPEKKLEIIIESESDILLIIGEFKKDLLEAIKKINNNEVFTEYQQKRLGNRVADMIDSYKVFLNNILKDFSGNIETRINKIPLFQYEQGSITTKLINVETPIIKLDKEGRKLAGEFFKAYSELKSNNKPLYFAWRNLSAGESQLLTLLTSLNEAIGKAKHSDIIILLDEVEVSLHPMWQKSIIKLLVDNLNAKAAKENKNVQIIIATHSPFILSDLPLNSLILLKRDCEENVVQQSELEDQPATLGANIHELYAHSFFMKDGLIGEYAKRKINEVADQLITYNSEKDKALDWVTIEKFINQIGEPIIKARLVELYNQKYRLFKPKETEGIKSEIEELKKRIEYLEKKSDES